MIKQKVKNVPVNAKIIYCPIDYYQSNEQIEKDSLFLKKCNAILSHSERLSSFLKPYNRNIYFVDHNNKYGLKQLNPYKENGYVLWVGVLHYLPYLLNWIKENPINLPIKALTNINSKSGKREADKLCKKLDVEIKDIEIHEWNETRQYEMMCECKAAIDIKGNDFNQYTKPPTKSQKYIVSGIPFATNKENYAVEYFSKRNFEIATPNNYWLSKEYWEKTIEQAKSLEIDLSLENVGKQFLTAIESGPQTLF